MKKITSIIDYRLVQMYYLFLKKFLQADQRQDETK